MSNKPKRPVLSPTAEESMVYPLSEEEYRRGIATLKNNRPDGIDDVLVEHQTDTACSWLVCHSATVGGTVRGNTVQIVSTYPASPEARPPSFLGKPAVRPRSMAGGAPTPCGRH